MSESHQAQILFSVITITRNNLSGLARTYDSVVAQTYKDYEWIVIDGNSSDGSQDFLRHETGGITQKTILSQADDGIYDAMNKGIRAARGAYIIFMNAGDIFADQKVLEVIAAITPESPDFIYGDAQEAGQRDDTNPPFYKAARRHQDVHWGMFTHHQAMIYSMRVIEAQKLRYSLRYDIAGDYEFTVRFLRSAEKISYLPKPICVFAAGGISQQQAFLGRREQFMIREDLNIVNPAMNIWIFMVQSLSWRLKRHCPALQRIIKKHVL